MSSHPTETVITDAQIVAGDEVLHGTVLLRDGLIADLSEGGSAAPGAIQCDGDYLIPGLIELHTDAIERHLHPRPNVEWPVEAAAIAYDGEFASLGVTTVFDSFRIGEVFMSFSGAYAPRAVAAIDALRRRDLLKADHYLHLRCEICAPSVLEEFAELGEHPRLRMMSLMDHTIGQRQFRDEAKNRNYFLQQKGMSEQEMLKTIEDSERYQVEYAAPHRAALAAKAETIRGAGGVCAVAGHDDATAEDVAQSARAGANIAEFPTTLEAARLAREAGMLNLMGAPNLLRGESHSGNVPAIALAREGLLDILSSDYAPSSLINAAFKLAEETDYGLPRAIAAVTSAPAKAVRLADRGVIAPGLRADLTRVRRSEGVCAVRGVWSAGLRVG